MLDELYEAKATLGAKAAQARPALFSKNVFEQELVERATSEQIALIEVAALFA